MNLEDIKAKISEMELHLENKNDYINIIEGKYKMLEEEFDNLVKQLNQINTENKELKNQINQDSGWSPREQELLLQLNETYKDFEEAVYQYNKLENEFHNELKRR